MPYLTPTFGSGVSIMTPPAHAIPEEKVRSQLRAAYSQLTQFEEFFSFYGKALNRSDKRLKRISFWPDQIGRRENRWEAEIIDQRFAWRSTDRAPNRER
jgi:hypothetical protein